MAKPAPPEAYRCPHCGAELGQTDGKTLQIGLLCIDRSLVFWCKACGGRVTWREAPEKPPVRPCCGVVARP
jgi:DNA-directed RNA polymerase subunit RPC12/RpoP